MYPWSEFLAVRCTICPRSASKAICRHPCAIDAADHASSLQIPVQRSCSSLRSRRRVAADLPREDFLAARLPQRVYVHSHLPCLSRFLFRRLTLPDVNSAAVRVYPRLYQRLPAALRYSRPRRSPVLSECIIWVKRMDEDRFFKKKKKINTFLPYILLYLK